MRSPLFGPLFGVPLTAATVAPCFACAFHSIQTSSGETMLTTSTGISEGAGFSLVVLVATALIWGARQVKSARNIAQHAIA